MVKYGLLHNHTMYSLHDGAQTPDELAETAAAMGAKNITLTDHGTLLGIEPFMDACKKYNINGIPGVEAYLNDSHTHLIIVAKNYNGYVSIAHAMRDANTNITLPSWNKKLPFPVMTYEMAEKHFKGNQNVFATSACIAGPISRILLSKRQMLRRIQSHLDKYQQAHSVYIENKTLYDHANEEMRKSREEKNEFTKIEKTKERELKKLEARLSKLKKQADSAQGDVQNAAQKEEIDQAESEKRRLTEGIEQAKAVVQSCKDIIAAKTKEKKDYKKNIDKNKTKHERYVEAEREYNKINIIRDDHLYESAKKEIRRLKGIFSEFYIELQYHGLEDEAYVMPLLARLAEETKTPLIAANDAHMAKKEDIVIRQIMKFKRFKKHEEISDSDRELYLKTDEDLSASLMKILPEETVKKAFDNLIVLEGCRVMFPDEKHYPKISDSEAQFDLLLKQARQKRIDAGMWDERYEKRLRHEVNIIRKMGYVDYHMVVRDFCFEGRKLGVIPKNKLKYAPEDFNDIDKWIKENGFRCGVGIGPGRGSAAGSLVCFLLGITNIDPIRYDLLFERFLNPERVSMPDIDTDIKTSMRPLIIKYMKWRYGDRAVSSIATETTYGAKEALNNAGRDRASELYDALPAKEALVKKRAYMKKVLSVTDAVPETPDITLDKAKDEIEKVIGNDPELQLVLSRAKLIEGRISGTGVHAGGVVISDNDDICDYIPLAWNTEKEVWTTQCNMLKVEERGMIKMDLLGLAQLDIISDCLQMIMENTGHAIDIDKVPFEKEVFCNIYAKGQTNNVFQFESQGMKRMLRSFRPSSFDDIILLVAAYRPGPMQYLEDIIKRKNGSEPIQYKTPLLKDILSSTYGAIIYQEQVMLIFQKLAGYSLGQSDLVRRAMSKKKLEKLAKERHDFIFGNKERSIHGCLLAGISEDAANELFDEMTEFAKYAFNKSHAAAYAFVSYQTAWLKYHYTAEYLCAVFNNKEQAKNKNESRYNGVLEDCHLFGVRLLPPDINRSAFEFKTEEGAIRYGMKGIRGVGGGMEEKVNMVLQIRSNKDEEAPYARFTDFILRTQKDGKPVLEAACVKNLIDAGAFDGQCKNRLFLKETYENEIIPFFKKPENDAALRSALPEIQSEIDCSPDPDEEEKKNAISKEAYLLETVVSIDPLSKWHSDEYYGCRPISTAQEEAGYMNLFGIVIEAKQKTSNKGNNMLQLSMLGHTGQCSVIVMNPEEKWLSSDPDKYNGNAVIVGGSWKNGTFFGSRIQFVDPQGKPLTAIIHTKKEAEWIINAARFPGPYCLRIRSYVVGKDMHSTPIGYMQKPLFVSRRFIEMTKYAGVKLLPDL